MKHLEARDWFGQPYPEIRGSVSLQNRIEPELADHRSGRSEADGMNDIWAINPNQKRGELEGWTCYPMRWGRPSGWNTGHKD